MNPTRRAHGKRLLADLAEVEREQVELHLRAASLAQRKAEILQQIAGADVELETARKRRKDVRPLVKPKPDELAVRAARSVRRALGV